MTDATGITVGRCACGAEIARDHQYLLVHRVR